MSHVCRNLNAIQSRRAALTACFIAIATTISLSGCAPDAIRNNNATGFNGYLNSLKTTCPNLRIGTSNVGQWIEYGSGDNDYNYWLDMTSRLYYNRISQAEYRSAVGAQLGASTGNDVAFNCMFSALPAQRDFAPPPAGVIRY